MSAAKHSRILQDAGYESLLFTSVSFHSAASYNNVVDETNSVSFNSNPTFRQPSTPINSTNFKFNSSISPDFKQQHIADVNSFYFASIHRSRTKPSESIKSPFNRAQKSNFGDFSASTSNSPIKFIANSPNLVLNPGDYINQRDNLKSKLLRSPAFKLPANSSHPYQPAKSVIQSFSSRLESNSDFLCSTTPTQEEFMELLFKNNHMPRNPEFLIGRNIGVEFVDVIGELSKRSMNNVLANIFKYLETNDLVHVASVNKEWRTCLKQTENFNKKRTEFIKFKKNIYETNKENRGKLNVPYYELVNDSNANYLELSVSQKRERFWKPSSVSISGQQQPLVFAEIDSNILNASSRIARVDFFGSSSFEAELNHLRIADFDKVNDAGKSKMVTKIRNEELVCPKSIFKHLKISSNKKQGNEVSNCKINLIGSKKSKKNLKRL